MDPASGDQPLFNEDRTIIVTVNGEIYNYKELRKHILEKCPGKKFATESDCEVRGGGGYRWEAGGWGGGGVGLAGLLPVERASGREGAARRGVRGPRWTAGHLRRSGGAEVQGPGQ